MNFALEAQECNNHDRILWMHNDPKLKETTYHPVTSLSYTKMHGI